VYYFFVKLFETIVGFSRSPLFWIFLISAGVFSDNSNINGWSSELALLFAAFATLLYHGGKAIFKELMKQIKIRKRKP
jgi:hypothetical protein